jgi:hypothetical protein
LRRRRKKKASAAREIRTARPPMVPPTIAPVREPESVDAGGAAAGEEVAAELATTVDADEDAEVVADDDEDDDDVVDDSIELDLLVIVPSVVGSLRVLIPCVYETLTVGRVRAVVIPLALFITVAARSLAVPQPNCEKPPSKTF